ncbi:MAG: helix-turn-helix transcriptional regulator [Erysipelotrichaceae bacterium]|nr:helix-turn-helix transcriptional regulator [Erysipelotrichaceae bacterium]
MRNNDKTDKLIGEALKEARLNKNYSLADVANKIPGISRSSIYKFETCDRSISVDNLIRVCKVLDVDYKQLMDDIAKKI